MALAWPFRVTVVVKGKLTLNVPVEVMRIGGKRTARDVKQAAISRVSSFWDHYYKIELNDSDIQVMKITSEHNPSRVYWEAGQEDDRHV